MNLWLQFFIRTRLAKYLKNSIIYLHTVSDSGEKRNPFLYFFCFWNFSLLSLPQIPSEYLKKEKKRRIYERERERVYLRKRHTQTHTHTEGNGQQERETDNQTDRRTERDRETNRNRNRFRLTDKENQRQKERESERERKMFISEFQRQVLILARWA